MKIKIPALISAVAVAAVLAACSASAIDFGGNENTNDKITLTNIVYDSENKSLDYTLTNGTDDKLIDYTSQHSIYKIENGKIIG